MQTPPISRRSLLGAAASLPFTGIAKAQGWPQRGVTLVVPSPAGNPTDAVARKLQPLLAQLLQQTVIVENVGGASGTLGASKVLSAARDGHSVLVGTPSDLILGPALVPAARYAPADFRPVGLLGRVPYILVSRSDLPQASLADLMAYKERTGAKPLSYASAGPGSLIHLISAQFGKATGIPLLHVPYRGVPPMIQDLLANQVDLAFLPLAGSTAGYIEQGKLRPYGVTSAEPYSLFPQWKPLAPQHRNLEGFYFDVWAGLQVPRSVPEQVAQRWNQMFYEASSAPEFREWVRVGGTELTPRMSLAELDEFYRGEITRYQALARSVGVGQ